MTIIHKGINRAQTDISDDYGVAQFVQGATFKNIGEIGRRPGLGRTSMASLTSPIYTMLCGWADVPYLITFGSTGTLASERDPSILWTDVKLRPPVVAFCRIYSQSSNGTGAGNTGYTMPVACCAGNLSVAASEDANSGSATGAIFTVVMLPGGGGVTGCLVNSGTTFPIPANTTSMTINIATNCAGGVRTVNWATSIA